MKWLERTVLGLVLGAMLWALGCGGDEAPPPPTISKIEVRNGTWHIHVNTTFTGPDSCLARTPVTADTNDVICNVSLVTGDTQFPFTCDLTQNGSDVTFDCTGRIDLGICWQMADIKGGGSITDTTFDLEFKLTQWVRAKDPSNTENCELFYGRFVDACTTWVASTGSWVDSTGAFRCPSDTLSKTVPFSRILSGMIRPGETEPTSP
jgi:hypothetical protein